MSVQYAQLGNRILKEGIMVHNERTGKNCLTIINADLHYSPNLFPIVTTRKSYWKAAIAELLGYIRGYDSAEDFRKLGTPTWDANANLNEAWLANPSRRGKDHMGLVYGALARNYPSFTTNGAMHFKDVLRELVEKLQDHNDDRGLILNFWNDGVFDIGCLRPCMYSHHFSILKGTLYLNSTQRSCDVPLGLNFNMVQVYAFMAIMAQISGLERGECYHKLVNTHVYEDQLELFKEEMSRTPTNAMPQLKINPEIKTLADLETWVTVDDFEVVGYDEEGVDFLAPIKYPFSV